MKEFGDESRAHRYRALLLSLLFEGGIAILAIVLGFVTRTPLYEMFSLDMWQLLRSLIFLPPLVILFYIMLHSDMGIFTRIRDVLEEVLKPMFSESSVVDLLMISLLAGFAEELLFRGIIQATIGNFIGPVTGLLIASFLFGIAHMLTPGYAIIAGFAGIYLGLLFMWSGNLLVPMLIHGLYDFFALYYYLKIIGSGQGSPERIRAGVNAPTRYP